MGEMNYINSYSFFKINKLIYHFEYKGLALDTMHREEFIIEEQLVSLPRTSTECCRTTEISLCQQSIS